MLSSILVSCLLFTFFLVMDAAGASDRSKRLSSLLFQSVSDNSKLDFALSKKLLSQFRSDDVITGNVYNDIPLLHHLLNLHRTFTSARDKADLLDIFVAALDVGADPSTPYKEDPPLIFKAILLKEMHLCKKIVSSSASVVHSLLFGKTQWSSMFVTHLYSLPSESVPLAKLLLHADTIIREKGQSAMGGLDGIKKLLSGASLGKPAVKSADLAVHSTTYERILTTLGANNEGKIRLLDIISSLDELAASVHESLVAVLLEDAASALRFVQLITDADQMARTAYPMGRNALHFLCLSGGSAMLGQLGRLLLGLREDVESADVHTDGTASASVAVICDELFRKALTTADRRGHTPISYAVMRFSAASPVAFALRSLCAQLGLDFDQEVAYVRERGILRAPAPGGETTPTSTVDRAVPDGGWRTTRFAASAAVGEPDPRVVEVDSAVLLPSNKEFFARYLNAGSPVIFRRSTAPAVTGGGAASDSVSVTQGVFRKDNFLSGYGDITVPAATIPYAGTFGKKQVMTTIRQVANSQDPVRPSPADVPLYTFCTPSAQWAPKLLADVPVPRSLRRSPAGSEGEDDCGVGAVDAATQSWSFEIQFYLGPAGTGAPAHFHGHAMNTLAYGTKDWLLYPPVEAFYSTTPAQALFASLPATNADTSTAQPVRVTQRAGDVLYVPALWGHATLNTAQSIGVAHEFSVESFCME